MSIRLFFTEGDNLLRAVGRMKPPDQSVRIGFIVGGKLHPGASAGVVVFHLGIAHFGNAHLASDPLEQFSGLLLLEAWHHMMGAETGDGR